MPPTKQGDPDEGNAGIEQGAQNNGAQIPPPAVSASASTGNNMTSSSSSSTAAAVPRLEGSYTYNLPNLANSIAAAFPGHADVISPAQLAGIAPVLQFQAQAQGQQGVGLSLDTNLINQLSSAAASGIASYNNISLVPAGLQNIPQVRAPAPPAPPAPVVPSQAQSSSSIIEQLQLALLAQLNGAAARSQQIPLATAGAASASLQQSQTLLDQMRAVQSAQQMNPLLSTQGTTPGALANNPYLLQQLAASQSVSNALPTMMGQQQLIQQLTAVQQNPSLPPPMIDPQQSQLVQSKIEENKATDQIVALLMSAQQAQQPRIAPANSVQNLAVANVVQGSTNIPSNASSSVAAPAAAAVGNALNENEDEEEVGNNVVKSTRAIDQRWMIRFEELQQFKQDNGHCRVPHGYPQNKKLSWWVMNQRAQYQKLKSGKRSWLSQERIQMLNEMDFAWNPIIGKSCDR